MFVSTSPPAKEVSSEFVNLENKFETLLKVVAELTKEVASIKQSYNTKPTSDPKPAKVVTPEKSSNTPFNKTNSEHSLELLNQKIDNLHTLQESTITKIVEQTIGKCFTSFASVVIDKACEKTLKILSDNKYNHQTDSSTDDMSESSSSKSSKDSELKIITQTPPKSVITKTKPALKKTAKNTSIKILSPNSKNTRLTRSQTKIMPRAGRVGPGKN